MKYVLLLGRVFFSAIFILASFSHFTNSAIGFAGLHGVPMPEILVPLSGAVCLLGGLSVLLGFKARFGAWLLVIFLLPTTCMLHKFWDAPTPIQVEIQHAMFMKNLALMGAAFIIAYFGSGPLSLSKK